MTPKEKLFLLLLLGATILLRLGYLGEIRDNPFFESPTLDEAIHYQWASNLARHIPWFPDEPYFRAPLYPWFLSALLALSKGALFLPRLIQLLIGAVTPILLYLLGRAVVGRSAAAAGATILALYGLAFYFDGQLLIVPILLPLTLLYLLVLLCAVERPMPRISFLAGVLLGVTATARPNILLFGAAIPAAMLFFRSIRRDTVRRFALPYLLGTAGAIAPVTLHNVAAGDRVLISWQGGTNFWIGNNPSSDGMTAIAPGTEGTWWGGYRDLIRIAEKNEGHELLRSEVSRYWFRRTLRFFEDEPRKAAALFAKKLYLLLNDFEVSNNQGIYFFLRYSKILTFLTSFGFGILFPLAAAGMVLMRWDRKSFLLFLFLVFYGASIVLFFVTARYRMPIVAVLPLFAGRALTRWAGAARGAFRHRPIGRRLPLSIGVFLAALLLSNSNLYGLDRGRMTQGYYNVGVVHLTARRFDEAIPWFRKALDEEGDYVNARYNLGLCYSYLGRLDDAEREFRRLLADRPGFAPAREALGSVIERKRAEKPTAESKSRADGRAR